MEYTITHERAEFLIQHFFEFSFGHEDDDEAGLPDRAAFDTIDNPLELHFVADNYNWDDGEEVLNWIINSPLCDKATAMMIFWRAQPDFYTERATKEDAGIEEETWELLQNIMRNMEQGFYTHAHLEYDPAKDPAAEETDIDNPDSKWKIPEFMKTPLKGVNVNTYYQSHYEA